MVKGPVLESGQSGYQAECAAYQRIVRHRPALVVGATGGADVAAAVSFAARHDLGIGVQATGHGAAVPADGGLLVSTRRMAGLHVDPGARTVRLEAGVRWEQVIHAAAAHGLAPLSGSSPDVGAVGYTLGGGLGLLGRKHGYAADHVRWIDVVTLDGRLRRTSPAEHPELFWALRGGKGNFGVVVAMEADLIPVPSLYGGVLIFPGRDAGDVLREYLRWSAEAPEEMSSSIALIRHASPDEVPGLRDGLAVHVRVAYLGSGRRGAELISPLRGLRPVLDTVADMPYTRVGSIHNDPREPGVYHERMMMLGRLDDQAAGVLMELAGPGARCPVRLVELRQLGGALGRAPAVPNSVGNRNAAFALFSASPAARQEEADEVAAAQARLLARMQPWGTGGKYVNFLAGRADPAEVLACYSAADHRRLATIKAAYDPRNLFRFTHNIPPAATAEDLRFDYSE
ncbi:FAD-binding oxidoreductase [Nonomuraea zeae]|uniref:FAD-binding oxidoreductase n=2 Tax=Nonomuraea zeae TaxID=1642303 RepID=A0A5S4GYD2_9ACTN|nr:FAD-binding oxidoreductase [Nonomuraea zeae]